MTEQANDNPSELTPDVVADFRKRSKSFSDARDGRVDRDEELTIDVNDLIGASGRPPHQTPEARRDLEHSMRSIGESSEINRNAEMTANTVDPEWIFKDEDGSYSECPERLLGHILERKGEEVVKQMQQALIDLREPIRTVAINCLYLGATPEQAADAFGTSIETIIFLTDVALDQLTSRLHLD